MPRHLHITKFLIFSFALHVLVLGTALFIIKPEKPLTPLPLPVDIINLPKQELENLPPLQPPPPVPPAPPVRPVPAPPAPSAPSIPRNIAPEKPLRPSEVPMPKKFGDSDEVKLPKTESRTGIPEGAEQGKETGKPGTKPYDKGGPLPFVSQNDIDELARKGMPEKNRAMNRSRSIRMSSSSFPTTAGSRSRSRACFAIPKSPLSPDTRERCISSLTS